jgi:hypothetical protein
MRTGPAIDLGAYLRAFVLYARNPQLVLAPLVMGLAGTIILLVSPPSNGLLGNLSGGITGLIVGLLDSFGLGVALILADAAWRRGRAPFDDAWSEGRRRLGDILLAALGYNFVLWAAGLAGGLLGNIGALALSAIAAYFFIYTIPAAAIGGVPGGAALSISLERVKRSYANTLLLAFIAVVIMVVLPAFWETLSAPLAAGVTFASPVVVSTLALAFIKAVGVGYLALVMSKAYNDVSYGRHF